MADLSFVLAARIVPLVLFLLGGGASPAAGSYPKRTRFSASSTRPPTWPVAVLGGLLIMGRRPRRPLVVATVITFAWAAPSAALALRAPLAVVCVAALVASCVSAIFGALWLTTVQQEVPPDALSRFMSYVSFGAYSIGPVGLALAGPISDATSISTVLAVGVGWQLLATSAVLAVPAIRHLHRREDQTISAARSTMADKSCQSSSRGRSSRG